VQRTPAAHQQNRSKIAEKKTAAKSHIENPWKKLAKKTAKRAKNL